MGYITSGAILMLISIIITIFTLGFGMICTGPIFLLGFIIFIIGFIISEGTKLEKITQNRFCVDCGRAIPFDARLCPYCGKNYETNQSTIKKERNCLKCGFNNDLDAIYCNKCGNKL